MFLIQALSLLLVRRAIPGLISSLAWMGCRKLEQRLLLLFAFRARRPTFLLFLSAASLYYYY
jgi:hypothetical protein